MIPILYPSGETAFTNNGLGRLADCISCEVTEERNGIFEVEFVYPVSGVHYSDIQIGCIIYTTHDALKTPQPFDIYKKSAPINGAVTFYAHHISYRLNEVVVKPFTTTGTAGTALNALKTNAVNACPFTFTSDRNTSLTYTVSLPNTLKQLLGGVQGSILDIYGGGDYTFNTWNVDFGTRGADHGVTIRYGKNMTELTAESDAEGTYNGVVPYWSNGETLVTLSEWYVSDGTSARLSPLDLSDEWTEAPTESELRTKAQARLTSSAPWTIDENINVSFVVQPEDYAELENLQRVALCDTVSVIYPAAGVSKKIRVIKTVYDPLTERYKSVELGKPQASLADTIRARTMEEVAKETISEGFMAQAIQTATDLIAGGLGGYVVIGRNANGEPEEILIMDSDDIQTAVNVIRMNQAGIGFSTSGYAGPYTSAWTIDGSFNTAFIQVTDLSALNADLGTVTAGKMQSTDYSYSSGNYSAAGMLIDLTNKLIRMPNTALLSDGSFYTKSGEIAGFKIDTGGLSTSYTVVDPNGIDPDVTYTFGIGSDVDSNTKVVLYIEQEVEGQTPTYPFVIRRNGFITDYNGQLDIGGVYVWLGPDDTRYGQSVITPTEIMLTSSSSNVHNGIEFYYSNAGSSPTSTIKETASGIITINAGLNATDYSNQTRRVPTSYATDGQRASGFGTTSTTFQMSGQWGTTGTTYSMRSLSVPSSDIRLKENVKDSEVDALELINRIKIREFDWKDGRHQNIGMVADEIEELDEKLAIGGGYTENGEMNTKSVDTFYLIGYLTKAIQELTDEIETLKRRLDDVTDTNI